MVQKLIIIGAQGKVGKTLIKQVFEQGDSDPKVHSNPTKIIGLVSIKEHVINPKGLSEKECIDFPKGVGKYKKHKSLGEIVGEVEKTKLPSNEGIVFVDATSARGIYPIHSKIIEETSFGIVTANKNPLVLCSFEQFNRLTKEPVRYGYRCSVMAGAEAVNFLQDLCDVNDKPSKISGCFSGTLGYICTELEKGKKLSSIIKDACEKGYTEPHPRDDLSGLDVARKLLVLARTSGYAVDLKDVKVEPFIPEKYLSIENAEEFL